MTKLKTYLGVKTTTELYQITATSKKKAQELYDSKTLLAATNNQEGISKMYFTPSLKPTFEIYETDKSND